jgi:hypothetical protein
VFDVMGPGAFWVVAANAAGGESDDVAGEIRVGFSAAGAVVAVIAEDLSVVEVEGRVCFSPDGSVVTVVVEAFTATFAAAEESAAGG